MIKVGVEYFRAWVDDETGKVEIDVHVCRVIRKDRAYMTLKASFTWGKRSRKHGDFGWLDPIPDWCKDRVKLDDRDYCLTKAAALRAAIARERKSREFYKKDPGVVADIDKAIAALQARLKRTK